MEWSSIKSFLDNSGVKSLFYIDEEGSEIPIDSECEFEEAIRLARLTNNELKLISYENKSKSKDPVSLHESQPTPKSSVEKFPKQKKIEMDDCMWKANNCKCRNEPPEWFLLYMKMLKEEIVHELKSHCSLTIQNLLEKNKKLLEEPDSSCNKKEATFMNVSTQCTSRIKPFENEKYTLNHSESNIKKKRKKLHQSEHEEFLLHQMKKIQEKIGLFLERNGHPKLRHEKNSYVTAKKKACKKSVRFSENIVGLIVAPGAEFSVILNIMNDGNVRWSDPWLECFKCSGVQLEEVKIPLPKLEPLHSCFLKIRGKASKNSGQYYFKYRFLDGQEKFETNYTCWINAGLSRINPSTGNLETQDRSKVYNDHLIDFEKDILSESQRKIEKNINVIEKRLQDIDLLQPPESEDNDFAQVESTTKRQKNEAFQIWNEREQEVCFGVDCLQMAMSKSKKQSEVGTTENDGEKKCVSDTLKNSDSEPCGTNSDEVYNSIMFPLSSPSSISSMSSYEEINSSNCVVSDGKRGEASCSKDGIQETIRSSLLEKKESRITEEEFESVHNHFIEKEESQNAEVKLESVRSNLSEKGESCNSEVKLETVRSRLREKGESCNAEGKFETVRSRLREKGESCNSEVKLETVRSRLREKGESCNAEGKFESVRSSLREKGESCNAEGKLESVRSSLKSEEETRKNEGISQNNCSDLQKEEELYTNILSGKKKEASDANNPSVKSRKSLYTEETSKKMTPGSTKYNFTADNLSQPTFIKQCFEERPLNVNYSFAREKERNASPLKFGATKTAKEGLVTKGKLKHHSPGSSRAFASSNKEKMNDPKSFKKIIPTKDSLKRTIYAVTNQGKCYSVEYLVNSNDHWKNANREGSDSGTRKEHSKTHDRRNSFNEVPPVNILPNAIVNGASNVASLAFSTAKSVMNNLQSAFVTEGKTEMGKPAFEENKKTFFSESMLRLQEMGFSNTELNAKLLFQYKNDLPKVVEKLIQINSSKEK